MTKLVGILNITPDSFSDGGYYLNSADALEAIERMIDEGVDVIDIGAESTRPGAAIIDEEEEWERLEPVLRHIHKFKVTFSLDTRNGQTAKRALEHGIHWLNDVTGFESIGMQEAARASNCSLVLMHSLGAPARKDVTLQVEDVVGELLRFANERISMLEKLGIARSRIIFDPGLGFGKTAEQSMTIIEDIGRFEELGAPLFIGHSRKSFLLQIDDDRDAATLAMSQYLALEHGIDYLRVHDVALHRDMLDCIEELYDRRH